MSGRHIEILAPAGSPDALTAAVRCGAAAVYLGVGSFNARQAAHNFTAAELSEIARYCHARGVAVHLALNTLVRDEEIETALSIAKAACDAGVDALILQDVGLARILRTCAPEMPLHASTQLSCHSPAGVDFLRDAGFTRVVLSREMSREEIAACAGRGVELEVFVHGALCMSVSGQCYFSAMLGGRSGNRGSCAQTCRLPFEATGNKPRPCPADKAALSLKDNCLADYVQELISLGVDSLKIEGRMKRPEYVAAATAVYSAAAKGEMVDPTALLHLKSVFSRTGFTDGYYTAERGAAMFGVRRKEDVVAATAVLGDLARTYDKETPLVAIDMSLTADENNTTLTVTDDGGTAVTVTGDGTQTAHHQPLDPARAEQQLRKTGGTPFAAKSVCVSIAPGQTMPTAAINSLRRQALELLLDKRGATEAIPFSSEVPAIPSVAASATPKRVVRLSDARQWTPALQADLVILPLSTPTDTIRQIAAAQPTGVEIPRGMFGTEDGIRQLLHKAAAAGAKAALCGNVGAIRPAAEASLFPVGGFSLNVTNAQAAAFYAERGVGATTLSMELSFDNVRRMGPLPLPIGLLLYGRQPLMLTRNCPRQSTTGTCKDCQHQGITDRTGTTFPVMCTGGCSEVLNSVPLYWGDRLQDVPPVAFHLFHFTTETAEDALSVLQAYDRHAAFPGNITRGLYRRGVE